jgi:hypothetical protein
MPVQDIVALNEHKALLWKAIFDADHTIVSAKHRFCHLC